MSQTEFNSTTNKWVDQLTRACRDTQFAFEAAAGAVRDRLLRAELLQYSGQRREFIAELTAVARKLGTEVVETGDIREPLARHAENIKAAMAYGDNVAAILEACEQSESSAMAVYRFVGARELPGNLHAMMTTHLSAITRVRDRLNRLRNNARMDRN